MFHSLIVLGKKLFIYEDILVNGCIKEDCGCVTN